MIAITRYRKAMLISIKCDKCGTRRDAPFWAASTATIDSVRMCCSISALKSGFTLVLKQTDDGHVYQACLCPNCYL